MLASIGIIMLKLFFSKIFLIIKAIWDACARQNGSGNSLLALQIFSLEEFE